MSELDRMRDLSSLSSHVQAKIARRFGAVLTPLEPAIKSVVRTRLQRSDSLEILNYKETAETDDRADGRKGVPLLGQITSISSDTKISPPKGLECFDIVRTQLSHIMDETQLTGFTKSVSPIQAQLCLCIYRRRIRGPGMLSLFRDSKKATRYQCRRLPGVQHL